MAVFLATREANYGDGPPERGAGAAWSRTAGSTSSPPRRWSRTSSSSRSILMDGLRLGLRHAMRAVLTLAASCAAALLVAGSAGAASGTPKSPLAAYGYHLYGQYCLALPRRRTPPDATTSPRPPSGAGPGRAQGQQGGIGPSLHGVGALAADFYLRTGYMPLRAHRPAAAAQPRLPERPPDPRARRVRRELRRPADPEAEAGARQPLAGPGAVHRALRRLPPGRRAGRLRHGRGAAGARRWRRRARSLKPCGSART